MHEETDKFPETPFTKHDFNRRTESLVQWRLIAIVFCGLWLYVIFAGTYNSSDTLITDWLIGLPIALLIITMLSLATGSLRNKLGFKSIKPEREVISSYAKNRIEGLAWFFNMLVVLLIICIVIPVFLAFAD